MLICLEEAKAHLRIMNTDNDYDILLKIAEASAIYMRHAKLESVPAEWFYGSPVQIQTPDSEKSSIKLILSELYENREAGISNPLSNAVKSLIDRDPTIA
jgi:hypothetical protein